MQVTDNPLQDRKLLQISSTNLFYDTQSEGIQQRKDTATLIESMQQQDYNSNDRESEKPLLINKDDFKRGEKEASQSPTPSPQSSPDSPVYQLKDSNQKEHTEKKEKKEMKAKNDSPPSTSNNNNSNNYNNNRRAEKNKKKLQQPQPRKSQFPVSKIHNNKASLHPNGLLIDDEEETERERQDSITIPNFSYDPTDSTSATAWVRSSKVVYGEESASLPSYPSANLNNNNNSSPNESSPNNASIRKIGSSRAIPVTRNTRAATINILGQTPPPNLTTSSITGRPIAQTEVRIFL